MIDSSSSHPDFRAVLARALGSQYRLGEEIGRGGMGVVLRASDLTLRRDVAVKVLNPDLVGHPAVVARFLAEARIIARLRHPNILPIHAAAEVEGEGLVYYVMDLVAGPTLRQRLARERRLPPDLAARIAADIASALEAAAEAGVVHRDIKPENILLEGSGPRALLADFGVARMLEGEGSITGPGVVMGTPAYMSPEQAGGEPIDIRSDLYALGVVTYEMLAGRPPFDGPPRVMLSRQILDPPEPLLRRRPDLPAALATAVMHALEKVPEARYQTPAEFRAAVLADQPVTPIAVTPLPRQPAPRRRGLLAAVAAVAIAAIGLWQLPRTAPPVEGNPRQSLVVLPFENLRDDPELAWLGDGSVNMLTLALSQWRELTVVDAERLRDLVGREQTRGPIGLESARRVARQAGVGSVVVGDYSRQGDSLVLVARTYDVASGRRIALAQAAGIASSDVRPLFDELARRILDISAGSDARVASLSQVTTWSLEGYRAYLTGSASLHRWELADAERSFRRAIVLDSTFALAHFRLALTRGWRYGESDPAARNAIAAAARHADRLAERERTMIAAYHATIESDHARSEILYQQLLARDSTDADAWYGLGDVLFHAPAHASASGRTRALHAFRRAIRIEPRYLLAYEHVNAILAAAAEPAPSFALVGPDSLAPVRRDDGTPLLEGAALRAAVARARAETIATAQAWVEAQPRSARARLAMFGAHLAAENYPAALDDAARLREILPESARGFTPFLEARARFNAGDAPGAGRAVRAGIAEFRPSVAVADLLGAPALQDVAAGANILAYLGDINGASRLISLADSVRRLLLAPETAATAGPSGRLETWQWARQAQLFSAAGVGRATLDTIWRRATEVARQASPRQGQALARSVAAAPIGIFLQAAPAPSPTPLRELEQLSGVPTDPGLKALEALNQGDAAGARRLLDLLGRGAPRPDPASGEVELWGFANGDSRPLAAEVLFRLGAYRETVELLRPFQPDQFAGRQFDPRWAILGRVRLLRGLSLERLGESQEAAREFTETLAQWQEADASLLPWVEEARAGLRRLAGRGRGG